MGGLIHVGAFDGREYIGSDRRLLLFEPQRRVFTDLIANLVGCRATFVHAAAGAQEGKAIIYRTAPGHSSSLLKPASLSGVSADGEETVRVTTVDAEIARFRLEGLFDELRIDTQGYELEVLRGAERTLKSLATVECSLHNPAVYVGAAELDQLSAFMGERAFRLARVTYPQSDDAVARYVPA